MLTNILVAMQLKTGFEPTTIMSALSKIELYLIDIKATDHLSGEAQHIFEINTVVHNALVS